MSLYDVYTGEMIALLLAIQWIEDITPLKSVICSDSCASLASLLYSLSECLDQTF